MSQERDQQENSGQQEARFNVESQYLKDLSFENPDPLEMLAQQTEKRPDVDIGYDVHVDEKSEDLYEVLLRVRGRSNFGKETTAYMIEISYGALVRLTNIPADHKATLLFVSVPTLLFPYVRNLISDLSRDGGYQSLLLNGLDFEQLYQTKIEQFKQQKEAQEQSTKESEA